MYDTHHITNERPRPGRRHPLRHWYWQVAVAMLLAVLVVEGQPVAASQASAAVQGRTVGWAQRGRVPAAAAASTAQDDRPDLRVTFGPSGEAQVGQPFRSTLQVQNDGASAGGVSVSVLVPPSFSNIRVAAPGFVCTRHFAASGPDAGTLVACSRNDLASGAGAEVTVEANAPSGPGSYRLAAAADPRDDVPEADEANNAATLSVEVRS